LTDLSYFGREILPLIQNVPLSQLVKATGLSLRYVSQIRRGESASSAALGGFAEPRSVYQGHGVMVTRGWQLLIDVAAGAHHRIALSPSYCDAGTAAQTRPWLTMIPSTARVCSGMRATIRFVAGSILNTVASMLFPCLERTRWAVTQTEPALR